jgi:hypothetical protein
MRACRLGIVRAEFEHQLLGRMEVGWDHVIEGKDDDVVAAQLRGRGWRNVTHAERCAELNDVFGPHHLRIDILCREFHQLRANANLKTRSSG